MKSALENRNLSLALASLLAACTAAPEATQEPVAEIQSSEQGLTHHVSAPQNSRGVTTFAGSIATARDSNYRVRFVVGPEMPIGVAENSTHKLLLGPMSPMGTIEATVTPFPQPERADYNFVHEADANWSLKLFRKTGDVCTFGIYERMETGRATLTGTWAGLAPGGTYCWRVTATTYAGMVVRTGEFSLQELPVFVATPTGKEGVAPHQLKTEVRGQISAPLLDGIVTYADGDCSNKITGLNFRDGGAGATNRTTVINLPGELPVDDQWSWEGWLQVDAAAQNKTIFGARGGKTKLHLVNNVPTLELTLTGAANVLSNPNNMAANPWMNLANGSINVPFTVTANYSGGMAPDGSFTATRFQRDQGTGQPNNQSWGQLVPLQAGGQYTLKVWLRSTTGEPQTVGLNISLANGAASGFNTSQSITVNGTWQEYSLSGTATVDDTYVIQVVRHTQIWGQTVDVLAWNPRLEEGPETTVTLSSSQGLNTNEWTHVAATYDGQTARLFVNGAVRAAQARAGRLAEGPLGAAVGNQWRVRGSVPNANAGDGFTGKLASMAMYDRGLTASEIAARHQRGPGSKLDGEVAWWSLDQAAGSSAPDISGSGLNATLVNMDNSDWVDDGDRRVLDFDGIDDHLSLGAVGSIPDIQDKDRFVISLDFKATGVSRQQGLYSAGNNVIRIDGGNIVAQLRDVNNNTSLFRGSKTLVADQWYELKFIFHQNQVRWYINGILDHSAVFEGPFRLSRVTTKLPRIGVSSFNSGTGVADQAFSGRMDNVRVIGAIGAWRLDEAAAYRPSRNTPARWVNVNSVYDSTGLRYAGMLGRSHVDEPTDGSRFADFLNTEDVGPWNLLRDTETMSSNRWSSSALVAGATDFTVTPNYSQATAPDGTNTAIRIQRTRANATDESVLFQNVCPREGCGNLYRFKPVNGNNHIISFWMKSTSNITQSIPYRFSRADNTNNPARNLDGNITVTGSWQEFSVVIPRVWRQTRVGVSLIRHLSTLPATVDVLIWGLQMKSGDTLTTPQLTDVDRNTHYPSTRFDNLTGGPNFCFQMTAHTPLGTITSYPLGRFSLPRDSTPPVITVDPVTVIAECDRPNAALLTVSAPAVTDNVDEAAAILVQPYLNGQAGPLVNFPYNFSLGSSVLHWKAQDTSGNVGWSNPNQTIRIRDTQDPIVTGGAPLVLEATSPNGTVTTPTPSSATDVCDASLSITVTPTTAFPLGDTQVTFVATDDSGNQGTDVRIVRIVDTTAPVFDPPLQNLSISRDASVCFQPVLPSPAVRDNGYQSSSLTVTNSRTSGPGLQNNCWEPGTHRVEWTISDPAGNSRTGIQLIEVVGGTLNIDNPHLEITGVSNPQAGRFYNREVHYVFGISNGTAPYQVSVVPAPDQMIVNSAGTEFRAIYRAEGAYPDILVVARDDGGSGTNFGSFDLGGFGIDTTAPTISPNLFDQTGVSVADSDSYPPFFRGETRSLENIWAIDADWDLANLSNKLLFTGDNVVTLAPTSSPLIPTSAQAASVETWVKVEALGNYTIMQVPISGPTANAHSALELRITSAGRVEFEVDGGVKTLTGAGTISQRKWHHIAASYTFDGGSLKLFIDGEPSAFRPSTPSGSGVTLGGRPHALIVGGRINESDTLTTSFDGEIAELHISADAITEAEVKSHYRGGVGRPVQADADSVVLYSFAGATQSVVDASSRGNTGILGLSTTVESEDPTRGLIQYPAAPASSGMERIQVVLERFDNVAADSFTLIDSTEQLTGTPLQIGSRLIGAIPCNARSSGACNWGDSSLRASLIRIWSGVPLGSYRISVIATDAAGNSTTQRTYLRTSNYQAALVKTISAVTNLVNDPNYAGISELEDALLSFQVALSYWNMSSQYADGSYLRADQGVQYLIEAENNGVDISRIPNDLARALYAEVNWHVEGVANGAHADDMAMVTNAGAYLETARFEGFRNRAGYQIAASRTAYDSVALLYPAYRTMRTTLRTVRERWASGIQLFTQGVSTEDQLRIDQIRTIQIRTLMESSRDVLENVMFPQVTAALSNPYTTERRTLDEILDVLDKTSSTDVDEIGDLIAITTPGLADACLDRLAILDLDDEIFTRCYLRLNDLARFLDSVSEPLVHTYLWRAGLGVVLFNMLELSLNVSPTGLPWVTANVSYPADLKLVLPDQQAASVPGALTVSSVDLPDNLLQTAYARYSEAKNYLDAGQVNSAWAIFVDERCLLLRTYNRYYSTLRSLPSAADPKEVPIDPATVGCGN